MDITILIKRALDAAAEEAGHCGARCKCEACEWMRYLLDYHLAHTVVKPLKRAFSYIN